MAGAGYKLFNTGDVLTAAQVNTYLMEQTVMVFADAAARTAALSGVVSEGMISYLKDTNAVEVYNGSAWVASDDPNAIQNTIVDAKGDLITATAADTPARLAVGSNGDTLLADSAASVGLRYQEPKAGNPVINSAMQIAQRGTSFSIAANTMTDTLDRWRTYIPNTGCTFSQQLTGDTTNLPNIQYCLRVARNSGQTVTGLMQLAQNFETVNSIPFAGKTVTLSFYARRGANFSSASNLLNVYLYSGTGTDQNLLQSYTGAATPINSTATLTTTWQRFSFTGTISASATEIAPYFTYTPTGTAGAADYYEITGVQLEVGSVATPFKTQGVTIAGELALCRRYLPAVMVGSGNTLNGYATAAGNSYVIAHFDTVARTAPTGILIPTLSGNFTLYAGGGGSGTPTALTFDSAGINSGMLQVTTGAGAPTLAANNAVALRSAASTSYILFTGCEL